VSEQSNISVIRFCSHIQNTNDFQLMPNDF